MPTATKNGIPTSYGLVRWPSTGIDSLLIALGLEAALTFPDSLVDFAPHTSDQHSFYFVMPADTGLRVVQLRASRVRSGRLRRGVPGALAKLLTNAVNLRYPDAVPWHPDSVEVYVSLWEPAPDTPPLGADGLLPGVAGPRWTRLDDPKSLNPDEEWSIRLPWSYASRLDSLLLRQREQQPIGLSGRNWVLDYRWVFPSEAEWRTRVGRLEF